MPETTNAPVELAIAHVLFIDIVGYSKLSAKEQNSAVATLKDIVQHCEAFQVAEKADPSSENSHWRWHGPGLLSQSGRARSMRDRNTPRVAANTGIKRKASVEAADGRP